MAPPNSVLNTTLRLLRDKLVDNSFLAHPLFRAIESAGNLVKVPGGSRIDEPVIFGDHTTITELTGAGFNPVSMAVTDPFNQARFEWANFTQPVILSSIEKLANKGDLAVVNILESKVNNVMLSLKKEVSKAVIANSSASITGLQTLYGATTAAGTGWLEGVAAASQQNTVGSGVVYPALHIPEIRFPASGNPYLSFRKDKPEERYNPQYLEGLEGRLMFERCPGNRMEEIERYRQMYGTNNT